jgi:MFS superfamily sulfate permease-like transporter
MQDSAVHTVIIDGASINQLDSSADAALRELHAEYAARDVRLCLAGAKGPVLDVLRRSGLFDQIGSDGFFFDVDEAVESVVRWSQSTSESPAVRTGHAAAPPSRATSASAEYPHE